jgi:hypothetical protein
VTLLKSFMVASPLLDASPLCRLLDDEIELLEHGGRVLTLHVGCT